MFRTQQHSNLTKLFKSVENIFTVLYVWTQDTFYVTAFIFCRSHFVIQAVHLFFKCYWKLRRVNSSILRCEKI